MSKKIITSFYKMSFCVTAMKGRNFYKLIFKVFFVIVLIGLIYFISYCVLLPQFEKTVITKKIAYFLYEPIELLRTKIPFFWKWTEKGYLLFGGEEDTASVRYYFKNKRKDFLWYDNGCIRTILESKDGKFDGVLAYYYPDDKIKLKINMQNGEHNGERIMYSRTGKIIDKQYYLKGLKHGDWSMCYENGKKLQEGKFDRGDGQVKAFLENGTLIASGVIENNKRNGTFLEIDINNIEIATYVNGKLIKSTIISPSTQYLKQIPNWDYIQ